MPAVPAITEAEWHVMKVLWDHPKDWLAASEIVEPVARERAIHHRTVRTLLARLAKKGAVETRPDSPASAAYRYRAKVARDAVIRQESRSFLARVFDGNAAPALVHFLQESHGKLSAQDLQTLRQMLQKKENP